ncbi:MAG: hypothetical protein N2506_01705 [Dehalococcoidales bacterium]|nr:hypothetical protein [Dehalococcoidales bacterium]
MNVKSFLVNLIVTFAVAFSVHAVVAYLWYFFRKGNLFIWEQAFVIALAIAVVISLTRSLGER